MNTSERILEFDVKRQRLIKHRGCDFSNIVAGTSGYLKAKFNFSHDEWAGCKKAASFWINGEETAVLLNKNDMCEIPPEVLVGDRFEVSVTGKNSNYKILTNKSTVKQEV